MTVKEIEYQGRKLTARQYANGWQIEIVTLRRERVTQTMTLREGGSNRRREKDRWRRGRFKDFWRTGNTSGSGEAIQTRNTTQGVRYKKSIALPRCISGPFRGRYLSRWHSA